MRMTSTRRRVLGVLKDFARNEESMTFAELARRASLYDYRHARRVVRDLLAMGKVR